MISLTSPVETWAHRIPAGAKLLALSIATLALFLLEPFMIAVATLAVAVLYLSAGLTFAAQGLRHLRMLWPFLLLIAVWHGVTGQAQAGAAIALRLLAALALANFVTMTTRLTDMIAIMTWLLAPLRRLGHPRGGTGHCHGLALHADAGGKRPAAGDVLAGAVAAASGLADRDADGRLGTGRRGPCRRSFARAGRDSARHPSEELKWNAT
jgi:hypothetical protein